MTGGVLPVSTTEPHAAVTVWTIGHSNQPAAAFVATLQSHAIELVCDVRRFPGSRAHPHFGQESLAALLDAHGTGYQWIAELGGRRRPSGAAAASGWRHPAFQAYAEHVRSEEFADGLMALLLASSGLRTAIMCSEAVWWRCHRRLIADVLVSLGCTVMHISGVGRAAAHVLQPPGRIVRGALTYQPLRS